jgi:hypothetical protein
LESIEQSGLREQLSQTVGTVGTDRTFGTVGTAGTVGTGVGDPEDGVTGAG